MTTDLRAASYQALNQKYGRAKDVTGTPNQTISQILTAKQKEAAYQQRIIDAAGGEKKYKELADQINTDLQTSQERVDKANQPYQPVASAVGGGEILQRKSDKSLWQPIASAQEGGYIITPQERFSENTRISARIANEAKVNERGFTNRQEEILAVQQMEEARKARREQIIQAVPLLYGSRAFVSGFLDPSGYSSYEASRRFNDNPLRNSKDFFTVAGATAGSFLPIAEFTNPAVRTATRVVASKTVQGLRYLDPVARTSDYVFSSKAAPTAVKYLASPNAIPTFGRLAAYGYGATKAKEYSEQKIVSPEASDVRYAATQSYLSKQGQFAGFIPTSFESFKTSASVGFANSDFKQELISEYEKRGYSYTEAYNLASKQYSLNKAFGVLDVSVLTNIESTSETIGQGIFARSFAKTSKDAAKIAGADIVGRSAVDVYKAYGSKFIVPGIVEGVSGVSYFDASTYGTLRPKDVVIGGGLGGAMASAIGPAIIYSQVAKPATSVVGRGAQKTGFTLLNVASNVIDPFEKAGDVSSAASYGRYAKAGNVVVTPKFSFEGEDYVRTTAGFKSKSGTFYPNYNDFSKSVFVSDVSDFTKVPRTPRPSAPTYTTQKSTDRSSRPTNPSRSIRTFTNLPAVQTSNDVRSLTSQSKTNIKVNTVSDVLTSVKVPTTSKSNVPSFVNSNVPALTTSRTPVTINNDISLKSVIGVPTNVNQNTNTNINTNVNTNVNQPVNTFVFPFVPPILFPDGGGLGSGRKGGRGGKQKFRYSPDITSIELGIKASKKPKGKYKLSSNRGTYIKRRSTGFTGLEVRGI